MEMATMIPRRPCGRGRGSAFSKIQRSDIIDTVHSITPPAPCGYQERMESDRNYNPETKSDKERAKSATALEAHLMLAEKRSPVPVASCAAEALNMLLQRYNKPVPTFEFQTARDASGRSVFYTTVEMRGVMGSAKEYNKKLCKQAASHQLLINLHKRYPKLQIPKYDPPKAVLTNFVGNSAEISEMVQEVSKMSLEENQENDNQINVQPQQEPPQMVRVEKPQPQVSVSAVEKLMKVAKNFQGIGAPEFAEVPGDESNKTKHEVVCRLGCEVVTGTGSSTYEAKEKAAEEMLKLVGQFEGSTSISTFKPSADTMEHFVTCASADPTIEVKSTQRRANDSWVTHFKIEAFGSGQSRNDSIRAALEKAKNSLEDAIAELNREE